MKTLIRISSLALVALIALITFASPSARADQPGKHPAFLHALSDLRYARANLEKKGGDSQMKWDESTAIGSIDRAIADIKQAAIDDGKNLDDHPPVDAKEPRAGRLHKALAALEKSRKDIKEQEDNSYANGLRDRAVADIDSAINFTKQGISNAEHQRESRASIARSTRRAFRVPDGGHRGPIGRSF